MSMVSNFVFHLVLAILNCDLLVISMVLMVSRYVLLAISSVVSISCALLVISMMSKYFFHFI
jgi:hypothetical protein